MEDNMKFPRNRIIFVRVNSEAEKRPILEEDHVARGKTQADADRAYADLQEREKRGEIVLVNVPQDMFKYAMEGWHIQQVADMALNRVEKEGWPQDEFFYLAAINNFLVN